MPESPTARAIRFGPFEVDWQAGELRNHGERVRLSGQPFEVLALLLERPGELVTHEELRTKLWQADTFVDFEHGLHAAVYKLREALGESAERPRYVETLPRRGYRFVGNVQLVAKTPEAPLAAAQEDASSEPIVVSASVVRRRWGLRPQVATLLGIATVLAALAVGYFWLRNWRRLKASAALHIQSLAVLPLDNLSRDPEQEYFADGMTEALIGDLAQIGALRVISRTSVMQYKNARKPLPQIARELHVDGIIEGTVQRGSDRVRISVQLIYAPSDRHLWAKTYERDLRDVLALQGDVARAIADEINAKLTRQEEARLVRSHPANPAAHEAYLKGRFHTNKLTEGGVNKGIEYFREAITIDPNYALGYAGLADAYYNLSNLHVSPREAMAKSRAAAMKALEIDDTLAEARNSLAMVMAYYDWEWSDAEKEFKRALELNPGYGLAHLYYGQHFADLGRHDEGVEEIKRALDLDPLSVEIRVCLGLALYQARQYDAAIEQYRGALDLDPNFFGAHWGLGCVYDKKGMYKEALAEYRKAYDSGGGPGALAGLGHGLAMAGRKNEAQKILDHLLTLSREQFVSGYSIATIYLGLGEKDKAFASMEKAYEQRAEDLAALKVDPMLDGLRSDPRFADLVRRVGLPP